MGFRILLPPAEFTPLGTDPFGTLKPQGLSVRANFLALAPIDFVFGLPVCLPLGVSPYAIIAPFLCSQTIVDFRLARYICCATHTVQFTRLPRSRYRMALLMLWLSLAHPVLLADPCLNLRWILTSASQALYSRTFCTYHRLVGQVGQARLVRHHDIVISMSPHLVAQDYL